MPATTRPDPVLIDFAGRTVLVTGAARGIGRGIVEGFVASGARVVATDVLAEPLRQMAAGIGDLVEPATLDVTDGAAVDALVGRIGAVDVLVHVAGGVMGQAPKPLESLTDADWDAIMDVNLRGAFHACRAVAAGMKQRRHGRIVVISSRAGLGGQPDRHPCLRHRQDGANRFRSPDRRRAWSPWHHGERRGTRIPPHQPRLRASVGVLWRGGAASHAEPYPDAAAGRARGHRQRRALPRFRPASWITGQVLPVTGGS